MVLVNYTTRELTAKVVYYGPGLCGKTSNLQYIYDSLPTDKRGKMISLATKTDRTLFFDFLPLDLGTIRGMRTRVQLYTVPGQVFYNETRKLVLRGVDGVVFVADSNRNMMDANQESLQNLQENLAEYDIDLHEVPLILQYNKRDLPNIYTIEEMNQVLNPRSVPYYEAIAIEGTGVHETLKAISKLVLKHLAKKFQEGSGTTISASSAEKSKAAAPVVAATPARPLAPPPRPQATAPAARSASIPVQGIPLAQPIFAEEEPPPSPARTAPTVVASSPGKPSLSPPRAASSGGARPAEDEEITIEMEEEETPAPPAVAPIAFAAAKAAEPAPSAKSASSAAEVDEFAGFGGGRAAGFDAFEEPSSASPSASGSAEPFPEFSGSESLRIEDDAGGDVEVTELREDDLRDWMSPRSAPPAPPPAHASRTPTAAPAAAATPVASQSLAPPVIQGGPIRIELPIELAGGHGELARDVVIPIEFSSPMGTQTVELRLALRFHPKK